VTISQPDYVAHWLLLSSSRVLRFSLQVFKHLSQLLCVQKIKCSIFSSAVDQHTSFHFPRSHTYNIFVCATTRASEKRQKKVSRNAELTDYAKSSASARSPIISSLCACDAMRAGLPNEQKKCTQNAGAIALAFETSFTLFHHRRARWFICLVSSSSSGKKRIKWNETNQRLKFNMS
jgi:hypothetical protein